MKRLQMDAESLKKSIKAGVTAAKSLGAELSKYSSATLVFSAVKESISAVNAALQDLSAASDATPEATILGKAMTGNTLALQKIRIKRTEVQQKIIEFGTETQQAEVMTEVFTLNMRDECRVSPCIIRS